MSLHISHYIAVCVQLKANMGITGEQCAALCSNTLMPYGPDMAESQSSETWRSMRSGAILLYATAQARPSCMLILMKFEFQYI